MWPTLNHPARTIRTAHFGLELHPRIATTTLALNVPRGMSAGLPRSLIVPLLGQRWRRSARKSSDYGRSSRPQVSSSIAPTIRETSRAERRVETR
jgi:hypothetical protein